LREREREREEKELIGRVICKFEISFGGLGVEENSFCGSRMMVTVHFIKS